jgi:hypothetical protein
MLSLQYVGSAQADVIPYRCGGDKGGIKFPVWSESAVREEGNGNWTLCEISPATKGNPPPPPSPPTLPVGYHRWRFTAYGKAENSQCIDSDIFGKFLKDEKIYL